ncbi:MAG TPA: YfiR family protein [Ferruginibacter sp.]|nr:YfiR family protein [Ferruginibacter sp.]
MLKRSLFLFLLISFAVNAAGQVEQRESDLKAVFIYNFTRYIEWGNDTGHEFVIGIISPSVIDRSLTEISKTNKVGNRRIVIRHFSKPEEISYCNILFIPKNCPFPLSSVLERVDKGTLTVSEEPGFARQGTAFNFIVINDKLKFEANLKAINAAGLKAGSQLLKLAIIID